jgi:CO dehydrogenase/acetyl-CoA synthase epsilon subunit
MSVKDPSWLAQYLRTRERVLIMAGALCDKVELGKKSLLDYVVEIAKKIKAPVAATGNTVVGLRARGINTKKAWAVELVNYMRYEWQDPIIDRKPEVLVFMGYAPILATNLVSAVKDAETVVLGNTYIEKATYSLPDVTSFKEWQKELTELVQALGNY